MAVITMSRQVGSGAEEVAQRLAQSLGLLVFEKGLLRQVADDLGLSTTDLVDYGETEYRRASFMDALFRRSRRVEEVLSTWEGGERDVAATRVLDEGLAIDLTRSAVEAACERGDMLIVGRGSQVILENRPGVVHVRVVAPLETRTNRLQVTRSMTVPQARRFIADRDEATREYLRRFYHADVDDPTLYHLVVNTALVGANRCVRLVSALLD